eukprot:jgi/Tetstr1/443803/TSEL_031791.t1
MMPGPEWLHLSYHIHVFLPKVDHEDEARRRKHETSRTMAAAEEMRHWNPEAHIGDDEYILADVKATVDEATAGKTDKHEMRKRGANARRPGQGQRGGRGSGAPTRGGRGSAAPTRGGR